ncbi:MAG: hypothetical protein F6K35_11580 [Okeania sp. SIO2H7]|nr:hypothetical protein [Okeania sp. SIO2H7]
MIQLSQEQLLYLLYSFAYLEKGGTVTQGNVKRHLPSKLQKDAQNLGDSLLELELLESPKKSRWKITEKGKRTLVENLQNTDYKFTSSKGYKVLNALLECMKLASEYSELNPPTEEMDIETFEEKFKELYFAERKRQELRGVVAIRTRNIRKKFLEENQISSSKFDRYFETLKSDGKIFAVIEQDEELIEWKE